MFLCIIFNDSPMFTFFREMFCPLEMTVSTALWNWQRLFCAKYGKRKTFASLCNYMQNIYSMLHILSGVKWHSINTLCLSLSGFLGFGIWVLFFWEHLHVFSIIIQFVEEANNSDSVSSSSSVGSMGTVHI